MFAQRKIFLLSVLALCAGLVPAAARAHDFKFAYVVPLSGAGAEAGRQALNGFLLASRERDGHADEEADGHLGGLDVYIIGIEANRQAPAILGEVERLIAEPGLHVLAALAPDGLSPALRARIAASGTLLIEAAAPPPRDIKTMDGELFSRAYAERFGHKPASAARRGYALARLIDRIVRAVAGDFSDPRHLRATARRLIEQR